MRVDERGGVEVAQKEFLSGVPVVFSLLWTQRSLQGCKFHQ